MLGRRIRFWIYIQYLFDKQWRALHSYASEKGVSLIGDLPIYVALDSADAWANPSVSGWTGTEIPSVWRAALPTILLKRASSGAIPSMTGRRRSGRAMPGGAGALNAF